MHCTDRTALPWPCTAMLQVSFVGVTQEKAEEMAKEQGFTLGVAKTSYKANSKVRMDGQLPLGVIVCGA